MKVSADYYGMSADWPMEMKVIAEFEEVDKNKTKFTLRYPDLKDEKTKDIRDMRQGWNQSLDKLEQSLR
jgi:uncharacterized protein YndB with AHSA1/START domain